jgi:hypothetical protein
MARKMTPELEAAISAFVETVHVTQEEHIHWRARKAGFQTADVKEGTPCSLTIGSDTYPGTVVSVTRKGDVITRVSVREDRAVGPVFVVDDKEAKILTFSRRKDGRLTEVGREMGHGFTVSFGYREERLDPSF